MGRGIWTEALWGLMFHGGILEYMEHLIQTHWGGLAHIGCIRMNNKDAAELYKMIPVGTEVVIVDGIYGPFGKGFRNLKSGMYGSDVMAIQKRLKELGFFNRK